jgi:hypothetical protein
VDYDAPAILRFMIGKALKHCPKRGVDMLIEAPRLSFVGLPRRISSSSF